MHTTDIIEGEFYVNEENGKVRQVMAFDGDGDLFWRQFSLRTGETHPWDRGKCSIGHLAAGWATRRATPAEVERMDVNTADTLLAQERQRRIRAALDSTFNDELLAEVRLRNLIAELTDDELRTEVQRRGMESTPQRPLFTVSHHPSVEAGTSLMINADTDHRYVSYFHGDLDQWIFTYDRETKRATLQGSDVGWDDITDVLPGGVANGLILSDNERLWLMAAWGAATHTPVQQAFKLQKQSAKEVMARVQQQLRERGRHE